MNRGQARDQGGPTYRDEILLGFTLSVYKQVLLNDQTSIVLDRDSRPNRFNPTYELAVK